MVIDFYIISPGRFLFGVGVILCVLSTFTSACISGDTWIIKLYYWTKTKSKNIGYVILKGLVYEFFIIGHSVAFIIVVWYIVIQIAGDSPSPMNLRIVFIPFLCLQHFGYICGIMPFKLISED
ncbi:hypothetical protein DesyoDRAFT_1270 [Desulfosporosinus youngiae DSM 17734]|uniref:Uncharacterized protein n=1 Tax=Desulfosporosinus youngiae DSM 17734 TaxID=768710 RepID=H5Y290_9FIRM|nr:hypothetical protein DesyoDRAFT_1270 [Desulfosporosinus youngiae DSM 17734]